MINNNNYRIVISYNTAPLCHRLASCATALIVPMKILISSA